MPAGRFVPRKFLYTVRKSQGAREGGGGGGGSTSPNPLLVAALGELIANNV